MKVFEFILISLAVYRVSVLISRDACPFRICTVARRTLPMLKCIFCVSIWVSLVFNLAYYFTINRQPILIVVALVFAMSTIAICLDVTFTSNVTND